VTSRLRVFVVGTRAQLIKVAPVIRACEQLELGCTLLMTGQHRDTMSDLVAEFGIKSPQIFARQAAERSTVKSLLSWLPGAYWGVSAKLRKMADAGNSLDVLVHGDTLSTLIGAAAARRCGARVVHLESGLTSGKLFDPFPEELCRRLVFRLTDVAMCPNSRAAEHMRRMHGAIVVETAGNTILDALALTGALTRKTETAAAPYLVVSLHRFQNIYNSARLRHLAALIEALANRFHVHFVLHPATQGRLEKKGLLEKLSSAPNVRLSPRMGYRDFLLLAAGAACVLTDGGSNQEELAALGVPTIVMRKRTERPDGLNANAIMESNLLQGVEEFVMSGRYEALRRAPITTGGESPSLRIARYLQT